MVERVVQFMRSQELLQKRQHVVVACSGGADSLALLDILLALRQAWQITVTVAHFEHGIRGAASRADAAFVESFARAHGVPCVLGAADVPARAREQGLSLELAARELRYAFLWKTVDAVGADVLATAHHADDQAETVLMRVLRGTGTAGLAAMRARGGKGGRQIRPLLSVTRAEIERYCAAQGLAYRHDAMNDCADYTRNDLRLNVLPYLRAHGNPHATRALCQLAEVAAAEDDCLEEVLSARWQELSCEGGTALRCAPLCALPLALRRRALRRLWREAGEEQDLGFRHVEALCHIALIGRTGSSLALPHGRRAQVSYGRLFLAAPKRQGRAAETAFVQIPGVTHWGALSVRTEVLSVPPMDTGDASEGAFYFSCPPAGQALVLRTRQAGDYMRLATGRKKLKDILIDDKIPREARDILPLLAAGSEILWIVGRRRSAAHAPDGGAILYVRIMEGEHTL